MSMCFFMGWYEKRARHAYGNVSTTASPEAENTITWVAITIMVMTHILTLFESSVQCVWCKQ